MAEIHETFTEDHLGELQWFNEPSFWRVDTEQRQLLIKTDPETDFWQRTHYGFRNDNGHFLYTQVQGNFVMETEISYSFRHQYDQAGLMVRLSPEDWIKTSLEYESGEPSKLGAVVTHQGFSDWSTQEFIGELTSLAFRIRRENDDYTVFCRNNSSETWVQLRLTHLEGAKVHCGLYACSPKEQGFSARFRYLHITE